MSKNLSIEQLNKLDREELIELIKEQQDELVKLDNKLQKFLEEVADLNRHRFGRSSEGFEVDGQISFYEKDGNVFFFS